jgi:hypothetical protein
VPSENIAIDESTVGFKHIIIFKTYNSKIPTKWGIRLFILADRDTGYVKSIIPNYRKVTDHVCNSLYYEKLLISRIVLSLMDRLSVSDFEDCHLFTDRYIAVLSWPKNWTIENVSKDFVFSLYALVGANFWSKTVHLVVRFYC